MLNYTKAELIVLPVALIVIVAITVGLYFLLKNKSENIRRIPLIVIAATILVLEVVKQIINICEGYSLWAIPLHFCSLFLFFFAFASFFKGKFAEFGKTMSFVCGTLFLLLFYINPTSIIGDSCKNIFASFSSFHTFIYHHFIILFYFIMLSLGLYQPTKMSLLHPIIGICGYAAIAIPMAYALNVNFCNILTSNIPFMETFRVACGQVAYLALMIIFACGVGCLAVYVMLLINKKIKRKN